MSSEMESYDDQDGPGDWFESGFTDACVHGDVIFKGQTIRRVVNGRVNEFEHKHCHEAGKAVFAPHYGNEGEPFEGDGYWPYPERY